jgi:hypothetical protein
MLRRPATNNRMVRWHRLTWHTMGPMRPAAACRSVRGACTPATGPPYRNHGNGEAPRARPGCSGPATGARVTSVPISPGGGYEADLTA